MTADASLQPQSRRTSLRCTLAVPCYNEEATIEACLDALAASSLPPGATWAEWIILDDASTDRTGERVGAWAAAHPGIPLRLDSSRERGGKAVRLEGIRAAIAGAGDPGAVLLVSDADCTVERDALPRLLAPFVADARLATTWGVAVPAGGPHRRRASRFQIVLLAELTRAAEPRAVRADGRLFALRPAALPDFRWRAGFIADDTQLAAAVRSAGARCCSIPDARTRALPAASFCDFYLQTYRSYAAEEAIAVSSTEAAGATPEGNGRAGARWRGAWRLGTAVARTTWREPLGLPAYVVARLVAAGMHRWHPAEFSDRWTPSTSTKVVSTPGTKAATGPLAVGPDRPGGGEPGGGRNGVAGTLDRAAGTAAQKARLAARTVETCANWPVVLATAASWHVNLLDRVLPRQLVVRTRGGLTLAAPRSVLGASPLYEVAIDDAYRLASLPFDAERALPLRVLDVGTHVGAFAVAIASRYPAARVLCFEPSPETGAYLQRNITANGLQDRVSWHSAALGAGSGTARLLRTDPCSCEATLEQTIAEPGAEGLEVAVVGLAEAVEELGPPDLVKLDCEGGEYGIVLETDPSLWASVRCILLEYHPVPSHSWDELATHLGGLGFRLGWHEPGSRPGLGMAMLHR